AAERERAGTRGPRDRPGRAHPTPAGASFGGGTGARALVLGRELPPADGYRRRRVGPPRHDRAIRPRPGLPGALPPGGLGGHRRRRAPGRTSPVGPRRDEPRAGRQPPRGRDRRPLTWETTGWSASRPAFSRKGSTSTRSPRRSARKAPSA